MSDEETVRTIYMVERKHPFECEICGRQIIEYELAQVVYVNADYWSVTCSGCTCDSVIPSRQKVEMSQP